MHFAAPVDSARADKNASEQLAAPKDATSLQLLIDVIAVFELPPSAAAAAASATGRAERRRDSRPVLDMRRAEAGFVPLQERRWCQ